jgi:hypothetical protein
MQPQIFNVARRKIASIGIRLSRIVKRSICSVLSQRWYTYVSHISRRS